MNTLEIFTLYILMSEDLRNLNEFNVMSTVLYTNDLLDSINRLTE